MNNQTKTLRKYGQTFKKRYNTALDFTIAFMEKELKKLAWYRLRRRVILNHRIKVINQIKDETDQQNIRIAKK